jgi:hypothetical protein
MTTALRDSSQSASSTKHSDLLDAFTAAAQHGDLAGLEGVLASDAVSSSACSAAA